MDEANKELIELTLNDDEFWPWLAQATQYSVEQCQQEISKLILAGTSEALQLLQQICVAYQQYKELASLVESSEGLTLMARDGMKISYIGYLRGKCPAGYQMLYYKQGGRVCKKCVKKKATGGVMSNDFTVGTTGENAVNAFKRAYLYRQGGAVTKYQWPAGPIDIIKGIGKILLPDEVRKAINKAIGRDNSGKGNKPKEPDVIYVPEPYPVEPPRPLKTEPATSVETDYVTVELPWLDPLSKKHPAISGNSLAKRVITNYQYLPADTAITVTGLNPYYYGSPTIDLTFYNYSIDGNRRAFDYLNGLFPQNLPDTVFVEKPVIKYVPRTTIQTPPSSTNDTINLRLINGGLWDEH